MYQHSILPKLKGYIEGPLSNVEMELEPTLNYLCDERLMKHNAEPEEPSRQETSTEEPQNEKPEFELEDPEFSSQMEAKKTTRLCSRACYSPYPMCKYQLFLTPDLNKRLATKCSFIFALGQLKFHDEEMLQLMEKKIIRKVGFNKDINLLQAAELCSTFGFRVSFTEGAWSRKTKVFRKTKTMCGVEGKIYHMGLIQDHMFANQEPLKITKFAFRNRLPEIGWTVHQIAKGKELVIKRNQAQKLITPFYAVKFLVESNLPYLF